MKRTTTSAAVAGLVGVLIALWGRGRLAPMASVAWGLAWVAVARFEGPLVSVPTAVAAVVAAAAVVVVTVVVRARAGWVGGRAGRAAAPVARNPLNYSSQESSRCRSIENFACANFLNIS